MAPRPSSARALDGAGSSPKPELLLADSPPDGHDPNAHPAWLDHHDRPGNDFGAHIGKRRERSKPGTPPHSTAMKGGTLTDKQVQSTLAVAANGRYDQSMAQPTTRTVAVELPGDFTEGADPALLSAQLRALWAVEQVRRKRCGVGKGAELAGVPRSAFMQLLGEHGVPVIDYSIDDLHEELDLLGAP